MSYPTTSYINLEERFKSIAGLASLETTDSAFLRQAVNRRVRTAYERYPWPEFTVIGEMLELAAGDDSTILTYGADPTQDTALSNDANVVFRIHKEDPTNNFYAEELTYISTMQDGFPAVKIISPGGAYVGNVYVTYRKDLRSVINAGSATSGYYGRGATDNPQVPYTFAEYAAFGAYADFLRGDGQTEKAQVEDQNAELILVSEIDKVRNQSRQFRHDVLQYRPQTQFRRHNVQAGGSPVNTSGTIFNNNVQ